MDPRVAAVDDESVVRQEHLQQEIQQQQRWQQYDWNTFTEFLSIEDPSVTTPQQCSSDHVIRFLIRYRKQFANKIFHTAHCQFYDPHRLSSDDPRSCHCPPTHDFSFLQGLVFRLSSAYKKNIGGQHGSNPFMSEEVWRYIQQVGKFQSRLRNNSWNSKKRKTHPSTATTAAADSSAPAQPLAASTEELAETEYEDLLSFMTPTSENTFEPFASEARFGLSSIASVYGRYEDKQRVIELMLSDDCRDRDVSIIRIAGACGVGKTTLTELVYNELTANEIFDAWAWVSVNERLDVNGVTKAIVESLTRSSCGLTELTEVQEAVKEELLGKKFFLVLDNVCNDDLSFWSSLLVSVWLS